MTQPILTRDDLRDMADDIMDRVDQRFDDMRQRGDERHHENVTRLSRIETECRATNGRVTTLEEQVRQLFKRVGAKIGAVTMKDFGVWSGIIAAVYLILTQVLGFTRP